MALHLLLCFTLYVLTVSSEFVPICNLTEFVLDEGHPPLPTGYIPDQFFYTARADIAEFNATFYLSEYFDGPGNRGRIETDAFGTKTIIISNYDQNQAFAFDSATGECTAFSLLAPPSPNAFSPTFLFGIVEGPNGTLHVGAPSTFLVFNNESVRYLGGDIDDSGDDICGVVPCVRWQTCTVSENMSSFTVDYYFTDPSSGWVTSGTNDSALVLVVLRAEDYNATTDEVTVQEHYYSYMPFQVGPSAVPDYLFQIPTGTPCKGRSAGQDLPPFPTYFSATSEYVDSTYSSVTKVYFDYQYQLVRYDYLDSTGPAISIQDFNIDVGYLITKNYQNCSIYPLANNDYTAFESTVSSSGDIQLVSAQQLLLASNEFNYSYQGVANVRGADVDSWISLRDFETLSPSTNLTNAVYQIFFTRPGYVVSSDFGSTTQPAIWQIRLQATANYIDAVSGEANSSNFTTEFNIFGFSPDEPDLDVFNSLLCLDSSEFVILNFAIVTNDTLQIPSIRPAVRDAVVKYVQAIGMPFITPLQLSSIQVYADQSSYNVSTHITNLTNVTSFIWDYTAQGVVDSITSGLNSGDLLPFNITIAIKSYQTRLLSTGELFVPVDTCQDCPLTLSVGETVGLSIAMFFAGWMFAIIFCLILFVLWSHKQKTTSGTKLDDFSATAVSYSKQETESDQCELVESADNAD